MSIAIVFEDKSLILIDKPAGIVVNRAETTARIATVQDWAEGRPDIKNGIERIKAKGETSDIEKEFADRGGIVHRLDKDTSGLLLIAKDPASFAKLKGQFQDRQVQKQYLSLVHGEVTPKEGEIKAPIERNPFNRKHFGVFPGGREAVTNFRVEKILVKGQEKYSLMVLFPYTGRTHQLRVHLKYIGHTIVADPIYGGRKQAREDLSFCPRLFLHAHKLAFTHPDSGDKMEFVSPLPPDLSGALDRLTVVQ